MERRSRTRIRGLLLALPLVAFGSVASAQEFRGTITGRVTDVSGAIIPGATITVTNTATGVAAAATSNETGNYTVPYLTPGPYSVAVELMGFRKVVRPVEVRVGDRIAVDAMLEPGDLAETIQVKAQAPLLDVTSGSSGQVIDEKRIASLPLSDGNPFVLARLAGGVTYTGDLKFSRPFDNAGTSALVADGAPGSNEFMLDGSPNMANKAGGLARVAFVPTSDSVQEFKVETATFDAQQGHTAGATVNVVLKSGTNTVRGSGYGFLRNDELSSNDFFLARAGRPKGQLSYKRWGGTAGGPVVRNRTFFFASFERLDDRFPEPQQYTVPTLAEREGDLSALLPLGIVIYDPLTAQKMPDGRIVRSPFPNNVIPKDRLSAVALNYLKYYPQPNQPGDAQGRNNYLSSNPRTDGFYSESYRVDHTFTDNQRLFVRYIRNHRREARNNWTGVVNGIRPTGNYLFRINDGITADHVFTINSQTLLDVRGAWSRFQEPNVRQDEGAIDAASLGFSSATAALFGGASYLPRFDIGGMSSLSDDPGIGNGTVHSIYSFQPTLSRFVGGHSMRAGYDFRVYKEHGFGPGNPAGLYVFRTDYTRQSNLSAPAPIGQDLAAFMLGMPTGGSIDRNTDRLNRTIYHALFFQDDWKASERLTLNLGLRYEYEGATTEEFNRNVRGFDTTSASPLEAAARAAYARNPIPEIAPDAFHVRGGLTFADSSNRGFWPPEKAVFEPRAGFAYRVNPSTVVRGGWGIYAAPFIIDGVNQPGFSQSTNVVPTLDTGLTFRANVANPFPDGVLDPPGSSLGLGTYVGRNVNFIPADRKQPRSMRWTVAFQRQLPGSWLVEAAYTGSHGYNLTTVVDLDPIPAGFLSTSASRDAAVITFLEGTAPNPFAGLVPGTALNGSVTRGQLLRLYPQFVVSSNYPAVGSQLSDGSNDYRAAQLRVERRFEAGYTLLVNYTWSRLRERVSRLNPTDTTYEDRVSDSDAPHHLTLSGVWELPFGRGHRWGGGSAWTNALTGGWSVQAMFQGQSGRPLCSTSATPGQFRYAPINGSGSSPCVLGNLYFAGDPTQLRANISTETVDNVFDTGGFYFHDPAVQARGADDPAKQRTDQRIRLLDNLRTLPTRLDGFRGQPLALWDISVVKRFPITDRVRLQFNLELLNAFNRVQFDTPTLDPTSSNFGKVTSQANLPRNIQLAAKLLF